VYAELKDVNPLSSRTSATPTPPASGATTPTPPSTVATDPSSGHLIIRVLEAKNLFLPNGVPLPEPIEKALASNPSAMASSPPVGGGKNRESLQRKQCWWLPYVLLEFDKNEVLIDALGGEMSGPFWMYKAALSVVVSLSVLSLCPDWQVDGGDWIKRRVKSVGNHSVGLPAYIPIGTGSRAERYGQRPLPRRCQVYSSL
jgi:hypothetical protein